MKQRKGVFCLEGDWWNNLKKPSTVEPILQLMAKADGYRVPYIHLNVADRPSFETYLKKWAQKKYSDHPILYLAFHGHEGGLSLGDERLNQNIISLPEIGALLEGKCNKRIFVFGCCETVAIDKRKLKSFLKQTGGLAICGYKGCVDWVVSTAFELIVLSTFQENAPTKPGMAAVGKKIVRHTGSLAKELGFRLVIND